MSEPRHVLDGVRNRIVRLGASPGDGDLFLDALFEQFALPDRTVAFVTQPVTGSAPLVPGGNRFEVRYGWWLDADADGGIDDIHDALDAQEDEFLWRGLASNEQVSIFGIRIPGSPPDSLTRPWQLHNRSDTWKFIIYDETSLEREEQRWQGVAGVNVDAGLLSTLQTVVIAGAQPSAGSPLGLDVDDPNGLVDVDRYEAVSSDAETLWLSSLSNADQALSPVGDILDRAMRAPGDFFAAFDNATSAVYGAVSPALDLALDAVRDSFDTNRAIRAVFPPLPKEPDHARDDFEDRAIFGGVGDLSGSFNQYPAYASAHHFFADVIWMQRYCAAPWVPGASSGLEDYAFCSSSFNGLDPLGGYVHERRSTGVSLTFAVHSILWRDLNRDTHVGEVCNPDDPAAFDAERNTCIGRMEYPHALDGAEIVDVCESSSAKGGSFTIRPVGGPWPPAILVRDFESTGRGLVEGSTRALAGDETVTLRWNHACELSTSARTLHARDAIYFPLGGTDAPLEVETGIALNGYRDAGLGVDIGREAVLDVDLLMPVL